MADEAPPPLDGELADLLAAERRRPDALDPAVDDRVLARVRAQTAPAPSTPAAPRGRWRDLALAAATGAAVGAGLHAALRPPPPRVVVERVVERRVEVPVVRYVTAPPDAAPADVASPPDVAPAPARPRPDPRPAADDDDSALVERARVALLRARPADALAAVDEHARRFPRGQFAEEREALAVQALAALGRPAEARRRAAAFHQRFPASPLRASVDAAASR